MACSVKLCLHFSVHLLFFAVKHKQLCLARTVIPSVLLVISVNYKKKTKLNISANLHQLMGSYCLICMKLLKYEEQYIKLMPDNSWGNMYNYLVNSPSDYTYNMKAWKLSTFFCATMFKTIINEIAKKSEFCSIKTKVQKYLFKHIY